VVQDACLRALKYFESFRARRGRAHAPGCSRSCATPLTARARSTRAGRNGVDETQHSGAVADEHPEAALLRADARESIGRALERLAPEFREVIVLRELEGLSYKEISDVTGVPVGTVMSRLSRARARLQEALT